MTAHTINQRALEAAMSAHIKGYERGEVLSDSCIRIIEAYEAAKLAALPADRVTRVARAIYSKIAWAYKWRAEHDPYETLNEHAVADLEDAARRAIAAMDVA